ncbi:MAG: hypothetical protein DHS20C18_22730 [Saprospiraceae bacterium]|nr:MAG: hypothetical protein DHS20C18_22730 [Saprospiraceae bacterium]
MQPAQLEYYFDQMRDPHSPHYNIGGYVDMVGLLDYDKMVAAIQAMVNVFDIHKVSIETPADKPLWQYDSTPNESDIRYFDFSAAADPEVHAQTWMKERFNQSFDLTKGPLWETALIRTAPDRVKLFLRYHHLLTDAFGFTIGIKFLAKKYSELLRGIDQESGQKSYLAEILKTQDYLSSERYTKDLQYWLNQFDNIPTPTLSKKHTTTGSATTKAGRTVYIISSERRDHYMALSESMGSSIHHLLLMALYIYYGRIRTEKEMIFGSTIFKRRKEQWETFGLFAGALPFKMHYNSSLSLSELAKQVKSQLLKDYRHQHLPVSHLNRELNLIQRDRDMLFEIIVNYLLVDFGTEFEDQKTEIIDLASDHSNVPMMLWWRDYNTQRNMELRVDFNLAYLQKEEVSLLLDRWFYIMDQFDANSGESIAEIDIIPPTEKELFKSFNQTEAISVDEGNLIQQFEKQAKETPHQPAVKSEKEVLSYDELNRLANQISAFLIQQYHIEKEESVAIQLHRGPWMIASILGVLKSGAAYLPLDLDTPKDRLHYILEDSSCKIVLDEVVLEQFRKQQTTFNENNPNTSIQPEHLAYIIYTSGSTGKPKGVMIEHHNLLDYATTFKNHFSLAPDDVVLQQASIAFDTSIEEIFPVLLSGGTLVVAKDPKDLEGMLQACETYGVTLLSTNPYILDYLNDVHTNYQFNFRVLISGGDVLKPAHLNNLYKKYSVFNTYGPTESTVCATYHKVELLEPLIPIGTAIRNRQVYILKPGTTQQQPLEVEGEICIAGQGVARGYLNRQDLTDQQFVSNPFSNDPNARMYRTGDLGYQRRDGVIGFTGRMDDQVKIRGFRIELGEIESVIAVSGIARQCVVTAIDDHHGNKQLVAYIVPQGDFDKAEIQQKLARQLPAYMVPLFILELADLPLTSNGKVNKKALPQPNTSECQEANFVAPKNLLETQLQNIWQEVLGLPKINVNAHFFDLGGHSLLATRVVTAIKQELGIAAQLNDLFAKPSIRELATHLNDQDRTSPGPAIGVVDNRPDKIPLSYSQEFIWFVDKREGSQHHHIPAMAKFEGELDRAALEEAFKLVVYRHEVLRTVVCEEDGEVVQKVMDGDSWSMKYSQAGYMNQEEVDRLAQDELNITFDLSRDYMLRVHLMKTGKREHLLVVVMHHIASDGWSIAILVRETLEIYDSIVNNRPVSLPDISHQYIDFVFWQRQALEAPWMQKKLSYWKEKLAGVPYTSLVTDYPRGEDRPTHGKTHYFALDDLTNRALRQLARQEGVTVFMTLLALLKVLLFRYTGQEDICIGSPIVNRTRKELEGLIGYFLNTIALRTALSGQPTFLELLTRIKQTTLEAYANQEMPFEKVIEAVNPGRHSNQTPLFQVFFNLLNHPRESMDMGELKIELLELEETASKFDLSFYVNDLADQITFTIIYDHTLFAKERIVNLTNHYQELAKAILENPGDAISQYNFLSVLELQDQSETLEDFFND